MKLPNSNVEPRPSFHATHGISLGPQSSHACARQLGAQSSEQAYIYISRYIYIVYIYMLQRAQNTAVDDIEI